MRTAAIGNAPAVKRPQRVMVRAPSTRPAPGCVARPAVGQARERPARAPRSARCDRRGDGALPVAFPERPMVVDVGSALVGPALVGATARDTRDNVWGVPATPRQGAASPRRARDGCADDGCSRPGVPASRGMRAATRARSSPGCSARLSRATGVPRKGARAADAVPVLPVQPREDAAAGGPSAIATGSSLDPADCLRVAPLDPRAHRGPRACIGERDGHGQKTC
jgi:hypothetical protein